MVKKSDDPVPRRQKYYAISEVVEITGVKAPTLRNWERRYPELRKVKRINNRRTYTYEHIEFILSKSHQNTQISDSTSDIQQSEEVKTDPEVSTIHESDSNSEERVTRSSEFTEKVLSIRTEVEEIRKLLKKIGARLKEQP